MNVCAAATACSCVSATNGPSGFDDPGRYANATHFGADRLTMTVQPRYTQLRRRNPFNMLSRTLILTKA